MAAQHNPRTVVRQCPAGMGLARNRDSLDSLDDLGRRSIFRVSKGLARLIASEIKELRVAPDSYEVSTEAVLMTAELYGTLALCLHDESRAVGGLMHLRFIGETGRPSDVTDISLGRVLAVLDRFKRGVLGTTAKRESIQARILAHAPLPLAAGEPTATLADLIRADFADSKVACGTQLIRRSEPLRVCFQPFQGRVWVARMDRKAG
jgi:chemotaxis receptor (MCP) glutamine deamidase CheD